MTTSSVPTDQAPPDVQAQAEADLAAGLTRLVGTERQVLESLGRIEQRLGGAPVEEPAAPSTNGTSFVATKTGSMFHRAECPVVAGRPDSELRKVQLPAEGMAPCKLCSPLEAPA